MEIQWKKVIGKLKACKEKGKDEIDTWGGLRYCDMCVCVCKRWGGMYRGLNNYKQERF